VSRGFKICLWVLGAYCVLMSPLIWEGLRDGNGTMNGAPAYIGLLAGLLVLNRRKPGASPGSAEKPRDGWRIRSFFRKRLNKG
jgi:hypothetical protein